jgi:hypothetical protein
LADALAGHSWPHHFRQSIDVDSVDVDPVLDVAAHASVHGSAPKMPIFSEQVRGSIPWRMNFSTQIDFSMDGVCASDHVGRNR